MAINEVTVTGRKFRKLVDETTKLWQRISFWTKASDVEFNDGKTAEEKLGMINGITDNLETKSSNIAASTKMVNALNNKLGGFEPILDATGKITGYKTDIGGADTVFPFSREIKKRNIYHIGSYEDATSTYIQGTVPIPSDCEEGYLIIDAQSIYQNNINNVSNSAYFTRYALSGGINSHNLIYCPTPNNMYNNIIKCKFQPGKNLTVTLYANTTIHHYWVYSIPVNIIY